MEVKRGFINTDLGELPEDWKLFTLGELAQIKDGTHQTPKYYEFGIPFYSVESITLNDFNNTKFISAEEHEFLTKSYKIEKDDVLMTRIGSIGDCKYIDWDANASFYVSLALLKFKDKTVGKYFVHYSKSQAFKSEVELNSLLHAIPKKINLGKINDIRITLPPTKAEQTAIATALSDMDALISSLEKLIEKKRAIKQGVMQELLRPKKGWVVRELGEICSFYNGKAHENYIDDNGDFIVVNSKFISTEGQIVKYSLINMFPLEKNDITMVMSDIPNGKALAKCFIIPESNKYALNQRICAIRSNEVDIDFLAMMMNRNKYYLAFDSGSGQTNLRKNEVLECPIPLPPTIEEQQYTSSVICEIENEIKSLEKILRKYIWLKLGMVQELLTGKTRLI